VCYASTVQRLGGSISVEVHKTAVKVGKVFWCGLCPLSHVVMRNCSASLTAHVLVKRVIKLLEYKVP